jgi:hypothetical protein
MPRIPATPIPQTLPTRRAARLEGNQYLNDPRLADAAPNYNRRQLYRMDGLFSTALERAIAHGLEHRPLRRR